MAWLWPVLALGGLILSLTAAVSIGTVTIPFETVWSVVAHKVLPGTVVPDWSAGHENIVWELRFPRAVLAVCVGGGLAAVGAALQAVTRNPLADPHLLGISSGAAFGAIVALMHTGLFLGLMTVPVLAFVGALAATAIVLAVARLTDAASAGRLVLAGVAVSFVIMSLANLLVFLGDPRAAHIVVYWTLGGLGRAQWDHLLYPVTALAVAGIYFTVHAGALNAMTIGDETAATLGIPVRRFRLSIFSMAAFATAVMVGFSGIIGFVGLMMPHLVRAVAGGDNRLVIPFSILAGALFLIWTDILARTLLAPEDLPIGILTGLIGGIFFVILLRRRR